MCGVLASGEWCQPWSPGLRSRCAPPGQASAAAATAELLKKQEELNRKAEELDRRERELQQAALGGTASKRGLGGGGGVLTVLKEEKHPQSMGAGARLRSLNLGAVPY